MDNATPAERWVNSVEGIFQSFFLRRIQISEVIEQRRIDTTGSGPGIFHTTQRRWQKANSRPSDRKGVKRMVEKFIGMSVGLGIMVLAAQQVSAQSAQNCAPRPVVLERLAEKYGETRQSIGLAGSGQVVEVFASAKTGSWTITVTTTRGVTCLVASGQAFEAVAEALGPAGDGA